MKPAIDRLRQGGEALAEGAIRAGMRHFFGYPHAPQTDMVSYLARRLPEVSGVFVQAESVRSSLGMALGASASGARVLASVAGSDFGAAGEVLSYLVAQELPVVLAWFQRSGPGMGGLAPSQEGLLQAVAGSGGCPIPVFAPMNAQEMHDLAVTAFDLADAHRHPVIVLVDALVASMVEAIDTPDGPFGLHHLPAKTWAVTGAKGRQRHVLHSRREGAEAISAETRLRTKETAMAADAVRFVAPDQQADVLVVAYGGAARVAEAGVRLAREAGVNAAVFRPISLWPFPTEALQAAASNRPVLSVEFGHGQLATLMRASGIQTPVTVHGGVAQPPTPESVAAAVRQLAGG
jgi:2-oxoglutarate ferredoxin oxidoreductase subunit alpha